MASIKQIQAALAQAGCSPGCIDGKMGRQTRAAILAFQRAQLLVVDGILGPETLTALFPTYVASTPPIVPTHMPWLSCAFDLLGTRDHPGKGICEAIDGGQCKLDLLDYNGEDMPWSNLVVAHCIGSQLPEEPLPSATLNARAWQRFGFEVTPQLGTLLVFWRESLSSGKGHLGFYWAQDDSTYHVLGGNDINSVSINRIAKDKLISARWPLTATVQSSFVVRANAYGKRLSIDGL